jgi:hypothetical protein
VRIADIIIIFSLVMYALFAPHSIALTQGSYLLGLVTWGVRIAASRKLKQARTPVDIALLGFFACCVISSFLSYDKVVSIKGLKSPAFFLAFYFVCNMVRDLRFARFLGLALVLSCLANVAYSAGQLAIGRGLRVDTINQNSPFAREGLEVGDVIIEVDDQKIKTAEDISRIVDSQRGRLHVKFLRNESMNEASVSRRAIIQSGKVEAERLGLTGSPGRNFRVTGFYSHYETYAEVLQLIAALAVGMLIAIPKKTSRTSIFLIASTLLIVSALIMTSTRAAMAGFAVSVVVMAIASAQRRTILVAALSILVLAALAVASLERSRGITIFDPKEGSTAYRLEVWREAAGLIKSHPVEGIGKGSEGKLKDELGLYDNGRLPPGHFHSTPIQIATWWGLPALAFYVALMTIFGIESHKLSRTLKASGQNDAWGLVLGGLGALVAFNISSLVHFNFGDGEVVMTFWLLTGLVFAVRRQVLEERADLKSEPVPERLKAGRSNKNRSQEREKDAEVSARAAGATRR